MDQIEDAAQFIVYIYIYSARRCGIPFENKDEKLYAA